MTGLMQIKVLRIVAPCLRELELTVMGVIWGYCYKNYYKNFRIISSWYRQTAFCILQRWWAISPYFSMRVKDTKEMSQ
jgi:hypothetical protein